MRVTIRVSPGARNDHIGGRWGEHEPVVLVVSVRARAIDGAANNAVCAVVAAAYGVPPRKVTVVSGHKSRTKILEIEGGDPSVTSDLVARS